MDKKYIPKVTIFYCINILTGNTPLHSTSNGVSDSIKLPCSGMTRDIYLLKAFESGADAVVVFVCPDKECRHVEGSIRAKKRVARVKKMLRDAGINDDRLSIFNISPGDNSTGEIIQSIQQQLILMGPLFPL